MSFINIFISLFILILPINAYSDDHKENNKKINSIKSTMDTSWNKQLKSLTDVTSEKWAALMTSTTVQSDQLKKAIAETWNEVVKETSAGKEMSNAGLAISHFINQEIKDASQSTAYSAALIEDGKWIDGIWYLSTHLLKDTDDNLANVVQESELLHTLGKITATSYGGPQGAAAYASWYTFKETKNPEIALKVGLMSGASKAGLSPIKPESLSQLLKNNIIIGVMAGISAAVAGEDEESIKDAFLNSTLLGLKESNAINTDKKAESQQEPTSRLKLESQNDQSFVPLSFMQDITPCACQKR